MAAGESSFPLLTTSTHHLDSAANGNATRCRRKSSTTTSDNRGVATNVAEVKRSHLANKQDVHQHGHARKRREARPMRRSARTLQFAARHAWIVPLVPLSCFLAAFAAKPTKTNPIYPFIRLSYELPPSTPDASVQYGKGPLDCLFVLFYTIALTFTREFIMQEVLLRLAKRWRLKAKKHARFNEQAYTALYFSFLGPVGLWVMSRTPMWYFNTTGMYAAHPNQTHDAPFKFYYLFQGAYWLQQLMVMVLGMEAPRKDYYELVAHHIISLALIGLSYRFHFTHLGLLVYITHDISDLFLAVSKCLNYLDSPAQVPWFLLFASVWIYLRHYLNLNILWSLLTEFRTIGPYINEWSVDWAAGQYKGLISNIIAFILLGSLQCLNLYWLYCIGRIAIRIAIKGETKDDRSDDDNEMDFEERKKLKVGAVGAQQEQLQVHNMELRKRT